MAVPSSEPAMVSPADVLAFARRLCDGVRRSRLERLRQGCMTDAEAARDIACADNLVRMAETEALLSETTLNRV